MLKLEIKFNDAQMRADISMLQSPSMPRWTNPSPSMAFAEKRSLMGRSAITEMGCLVTMVRLAGSSPP